MLPLTLSQWRATILAYRYCHRSFVYAYSRLHANNYSDISASNYKCSHCVLNMCLVYALFCGTTTTIFNNCDQIMRKYLIRLGEHIHSDTHTHVHMYKPIRTVYIALYLRISLLFIIAMHTRSQQMI